MNIFDILGPVMVGPSSSHTAGAVRIGLITRKLLGVQPKEAKISLHGSFAATGIGHGTDKALVAGLLGMQPDDIRIPNSEEIAKEQGIEITFENTVIRGAHPNTAILFVTAMDGRTIRVQASSLGGGRILVNKINETEVNFTGENPTLIVHNIDQPGYVANVTSLLSNQSVNIATMQLYRDQRGGYAVMFIETDEPIPEETIEWVKNLKGIVKVNYISTEGE